MGRNGKVDIRQLQNFQKELEESLSGKQLDLFIESCSKELAARLLAKVIKRTPVGNYPKETGKKGGTLRRGWTGGIDMKPEEYANFLKVQHVGDKYVIEIINPVEYASYVEYGHVQTLGRYVPALGKKLVKGWVEGKFMLKDSEIELHRDAPKILEKKLKKKLEELFK